MSNVTLSVDDEVIRKVRKIAFDKHTTLTNMVRDFLNATARMDIDGKGRARRRLDKSFAVLGRRMGKRTWTREELHER